MSRHGRAPRPTAEDPLRPPSPPAGFDPIVAGRPRRSGLLPSFKAPRGGPNSYIFTSGLEWQLGLWLELNPLVAEYGRVDVHADAARIRRIRPVSGFALCDPVRYAYEGAVGHLLGDAAARFVDGRPGRFEAGTLERKSTEEARAAFEAVRAYLAVEAGTFGLLLEGDLSRRWFLRSLWLHLWRFAYFGSDELLADVDAAWSADRSPRRLIEEFGGRDRPEIVTHAVMKVAGDALAAGRLPVDLDRADFDLDTVTRLRRPGERIALPRPLRVEPPQGYRAPEAEAQEPASWLNPEWLPADDAADFIARREAMQKMLLGAPARQFEALFGVGERRIQQIHADWKEHGDNRLRRYASRNSRGSRLPKEVKAPARRALRRAPQSTGADLAADDRVKQACARVLGRVPRADRFDRYIAELRRTDPAFRARPTGRGSVTDANAAGFTAVYGNRPGFIVEYDGERMNLLAQLLPGLAETDRAERLKAKDVSTTCPVGEVYSMHAPDQGELRRLLLRVARPKDGLVARAHAEHPWPLRCWPMVWAGDNAWIDEAEMFLSNLPEMGVCVVLEPAKRPETKGTIESGIGKDQKLHQDRQPNSTGRSPQAGRGRAPARYAAERGVGIRDVEGDALQTTIDGDLWGMNKRLRCRPIDAWNAGLRQFPVRTWEGPDGELVRRLRRPIGTRKMSGGRLSYKSRDYVKRWAGDPDDDPRNDLPYPVLREAAGLDGRTLVCTVDDGDVRTMEAYDPLTGVTVYLVCNRLGLEYRRPVSEFELEVEHALDRDLRADAQASRAGAASAIRARAAGRPRKRLARMASRQRELIARAFETSGAAPAPARRRPRRLEPAPAPIGEPARPAFTPRPGAYASPAIHRPPETRPATRQEDDR
jgi:hypothetical protein